MKFRIPLERYNQIVWAVIGSGVVLLATAGVVVAIVAAVFTSPRGVPVEVVEDGSAQAGKGVEVQVDVCPPVMLEGTPYQIIAVAADRIVVKNRALEGKRSRGLASKYGSGEADIGGCGYHGGGSLNITGAVLFRDTRDGSMRSLINQAALVQRLEYPVRPRKDEEREPFPPPGVLYWEIGMADTNGDGVLDGRDDIGAWLSDINGTRMTRITPPMSRVESKTYDEARRRLYLKVVQDSDGNRTLDDKDDHALIEVDVVQRRIVGTVLDSRRWSEQSRGIKALNQLP